MWMKRRPQFISCQLACDLLQGYAMLHEACDSDPSQTSPSDRLARATAAMRPLFRAASALRDPTGATERDEGGFGSPINGASAANGASWGRGAVAVTDRGVLRRAVQQLSIAGAGRYEYEGPQASGATWHGPPRLSLLLPAS